MRDRYYFRTMRYHVFAVMRRHDDNMPIEATPCSDLDTVEEWVSPKQHKGDAGAREYGRRRAFALNRREELSGPPASVTKDTHGAIRSL